MDLSRSLYFVTESETWVRMGLPLDPDFLDKLKKIEMDTSLSSSVRLRAAKAATRGAL